MPPLIDAMPGLIYHAAMPLADGRWWFPALLALVFLLAAPALRGPDAIMYYACTESLATDGDLNSIERLYAPGAAMPVSVTGAFPAFHNHGIVLFWLPLYRYAAALEEQAGSEAANAAFAFGALAVVPLALLLTWLLACRWYEPPAARRAVLLFLAGSPLLYYTLQEPLTAQLPALLCAVFLWWALADAATPRDWLRAGLLFGVCLAVKVDLWFYAVPCAVLLWRQQSWRGAVGFAAGVLPGLALRTGNDWLRYGTLAAGETHLLSPHRFILFEQLFSPYRGFFYCSPLLLLALGGVYAAWRNRHTAPARAALLLAGGGMLAGKLVFISLRSAWGGGSFGARPLLTEWPLFVLLYLELQGLLSRRGRRVLACAAGAAMVWNLGMATEYARHLDRAGTVAVPALERVAGALSWWATVAARGMEALPAKAWALPLLLAVLWLGWYCRVRMTAGGGRLVLQLVLLWLPGGYALVTLSNVVHHQANARALQARGFYAAAEVVSPAHMPFEDRIQSLGEMEHYYAVRGNAVMAEAMRREMHAAGRLMRASDEAYRARYGRVVRP